MTNTAPIASKAKTAVSDTTGDVIFVSDYVPPLRSGGYTLRIDQNLGVTASNLLLKSHEQRFAVLGPRFEVPLNLIHSVFPPAGNLGDHSNVLPHVMLTRRTLPWERGAALDKASTATKKAEASDKTAFKKTEVEAPWLGLIVLGEHEYEAADESNNKTIADGKSSEMARLRRTSMGYNSDKSHLHPADLDENDEWFPKLPLEVGDVSGDNTMPQVRVLRLPFAHREIVLANNLEALVYTAHARESNGESFATVIAPRLPPQGNENSKIWAFLVSLEGHYDEHGLATIEGNKDPLFVVLHNWSFVCKSEHEDFAGLLKNLDVAPLSLAHAIPTPTTEAAKQWVNSGHVAIPYDMRQGSQCAAWYRGPLSPSTSNTSTTPIKAEHADALARFDESTGLFDVTYSAAWQLGRSEMLADRSVALDLYHAKRAQAQQARSEDRKLAHIEIVTKPRATAPATLPASVHQWVEDVSLLKGIPFAYLLPDPRLLPPASIRCFQIDGVWMEAFLSGAFSVGYVPASLALTDFNPGWQYHDTGLTGVLIRSDVVSGWPEVLIEACEESLDLIKVKMTDRKTPILYHKLSKDILMVLFEGKVGTFSMRLPPERLHFGFDKVSNNGEIGPSKYEKTLRSMDGSEMEDPNNNDALVKVNADALKIAITDKGHVALDKVEAAMTQKAMAQQEVFQMSHAVFAMQMIEGSEEVFFNFNKEKTQ